MLSRRPIVVLALLPAALACSNSNTANPPSTAALADASLVDASVDGGPDLDMQASDFTCILDWPKVDNYRITNKLGNLTGALAVANSATGGHYPVGTVIQLIPGEAMVKRRVGFDPANNDWEFFALTASASGTTIDMRGGSEVTNAAGSCAGCHGGAMPQWDFVCDTTHGCKPLPLPVSFLLEVQSEDPRCAEAGTGAGTGTEAGAGD
jgi:hypothetical protein